MSDGVDPRASRFRALLRGRGLRATPPRLAALCALEARGAPMTHEALMSALAHTGVDRATLYRNLSDLRDAGLLRRFDLGDHVWRFELCAEDPEAHAHFLCEGCGAVLCLAAVELRLQDGRTPPGLVGARIHLDGLKLQGLCAACA